MKHWRTIASERIDDVFAECRQRDLKPPPKLNLVEWADEYRYVARENTANPGRWKTRRVPVSIGPMMAVTEKDTQVLTAMACTQLMKTEFLQNVASYHIHQDPSPILFIQPTQKLAVSFSKERFQKTVDTTPVLRELIPDAKSRDSGTTLEHKEYPGGALDFVGANSPTDLASRPKRITLADEVDLYPADAGGMGDPLALGEERSSTFNKRRLNVRVCSPSDEETSKIYHEYMASDQRKCFVRCPHCDEEQALYWSRETVQWDKDDNGNHLSNTAQYFCSKCGAGWSEKERKLALLRIADETDYGWRQTKPFTCCGKTHNPLEWGGAGHWNEKGRSHCPECKKASHYEGHAGFHVSKLYSTRHSLFDVVKEFLNSYKKPLMLRKWTNTALAEVVKGIKLALSAEGLAERVEGYSHEAIPEGVRLLVVGADTQDDRIEMTVVGYGLDDENWVIRHVVLDGDTAGKRVWDEFDRELRQVYYREDGKRLSIKATCIDSQGHRAAIVQSFCAKRKHRRIYAIKGKGNNAGHRQIWPKTPSRTKNSGEHVYIVGVDTAKDLIALQLGVQLPEDGEPTPNATHFPCDDLPADYFAQMTAEQAIIKEHAGKPVRCWEPKEEGIRNEAWDCKVCAAAARLSLPDRLISKPGSKQSLPKPALPNEPKEPKQMSRPEAPIKASRGTTRPAPKAARPKNKFRRRFQ
ncbi:Phage terminase large subunit (GpA) [Pseudovibrio sp. Ad5]|uniref:phage terminase large subunit family protein n=1 Tax=Pseudovibrio sp. Ad5 TaxID=989436 RepID=UPI0007B1C8C9|nr:terminase gpA endonuclease subunit [Pseudovibrio sp. Ad5]KZK97929.1 Phage terminase large subunit (GpA) [Pseudovibrio sp. Ad5]